MGQGGEEPCRLMCERDPEQLRHRSGVQEVGRKCRTEPTAGCRYCFFHDPAKAEERAAPQSAGGQRNRIAVLSTTAPDAPHFQCARRPQTSRRNDQPGALGSNGSQGCESDHLLYVTSFEGDRSERNESRLADLGIIVCSFEDMVF